MGTTLGNKLGNTIGTAVADKNDIQNQASKTISADGPDGSIAIAIPENNMRDNLIAEWEFIGEKLIGFLASMDKGTSIEFVLKLASGEGITIKPNALTIENHDKSIALSSSSLNIQYGSNAIRIDASGVTITGTIINLN